MSELDSNPKKGWANRPVALVLTKADECEACFDDPAAFAKRHAPGLWRHCQERFFKHRFFAAGVAVRVRTAQHRRATSRQRVPLRVEPRGIVEPFAWLVDCVGK